MGLFKRKQEPTGSVGPQSPMIVQPIQPEQSMPIQYQQQMPMNQQIQQQIQQLPQKKALIVGIEILQDGEYAFRVVTNYQLAFGECIINQ